MRFSVSAADATSVAGLVTENLQQLQTLNPEKRSVVTENHSDSIRSSHSLVAFGLKKPGGWECPTHALILREDGKL